MKLRLLLRRTLRRGIWGIAARIRPESRHRKEQEEVPSHRLRTVICRTPPLQHFSVPLTPAHEDLFCADPRRHIVELAGRGFRESSAHESRGLPTVVESMELVDPARQAILTTSLLQRGTYPLRLVADGEVKV